MSNPATWGLALALMLFAGCAGSPDPVKPRFDLAHLKRISVQPFGGAGSEVVTQEFIRQLAASSLTLSQKVEGADAVLSGAVTEYKPADKLMVYLGETSIPKGSGMVTVSNPVLSSYAPPVQSTAAAHAQMMSVGATVGVLVRLTDAKTNDVLWSDAFSYEALDAPTAVFHATQALLKSLSRILPAAKPRA